MRVGPLLLSGLIATSAARLASAHPPIGPIVSPEGPGRVSIAFESGASTVPVTVRTADAPARVLVSETSRGVGRVEVGELQPGRAYECEVDGRTSRFVAPPDANQEVRFVVFGDLRSGDGVHRQLVSQIAARSPDFYVTTGDLVPDGDSIEAWRNFFDIERPLTSQTLFLTARGNHDGDDGLFERLAGSQLDGHDTGDAYGSVDVGPAHFVLIDTEQPLSRGTRQYDFIQSDLAAHVDQPLIAVLHKPLFSTGRHGGDRVVHDALGPLFQRYGVDLVLQGHDHDYERSMPINGVTYVVTGGAGAPLFGAAGAPWTAVKESVFHYLTIDASATKLHIVATRLDGTQLDAFDIDPAANRNTAVSLADTQMPPPGGGGCAMIFFGRGRREHLGSAFGMFLPTIGFAAVRSVRRRRRRARS